MGVSVGPSLHVRVQLGSAYLDVGVGWKAVPNTPQWTHHAPEGKHRHHRHATVRRISFAIEYGRGTGANGG